MDIRLSGNLSINIGLSSDLLMDISLSGDLLMDIRFSFNLSMDIRLSSRVQVGIGYGGIIKSMVQTTIGNWGCSKSWSSGSNGSNTTISCIGSGSSSGVA